MTDALRDVLDGVRTIAECARDIAKERTKQIEIREHSRVEIEKVAAFRQVLLTYLDKAFDERKKTFDELFKRLDDAMAKGDVQMSAVIVDGVVKLADSSPFRALSDLAKTRAILKAPGKEWEF